MFTLCYSGGRVEETFAKTKFLQSAMRYRIVCIECKSKPSKNLLCQGNEAKPR